VNRQHVALRRQEEEEDVALCVSGGTPWNPDVDSLSLVQDLPIGATPRASGSAPSQVCHGGGQIQHA